MKNALAVGVGGFFGCIARYLTGVLIIRLLAAPVFPYATLLVNVVGCLLIGLLGGLAEHTQLLSPQLQLLLIVGALGGFTTYSAFGYQTLALVHEGRMLSAGLNVAAHITLGLSAVWLGELIARQV
ncbi:MAG TPA: fluoride efflux transporter CrcB [Pyrinomonadaceae bacterium]|nr:fluoride efflux transporter CrcB [Pyrinomonadaceae bacterium]